MPISIYPPTLKSTQPAFLYNITTYPIYFTLQKITSIKDIGHIQIRVVKQSNNRSIVDASRYPDGIIYKNISEVIDEPGNNSYSISILSSDLMESWQPGYLYKIQLRFGETSIFTSTANFATWKQQQIDNQTFSEWSTVMVIKAISQPNVYIKNAQSSKQDMISSDRTEITRTPIFTGAYEMDSASKEAEDTYIFKLYSGDHTGEEYLIEDSGWLQHNNIVDSVDSYRFKTVLNSDGNTKYTVSYAIRTINGYEQQAESYSFVVNESFLSVLTDIELIVDDSDSYCSENGCMNIYLITKKEISGSYIISRSSEKSNFQVYEDLKYVLCNKKLFTNETLVFQDFTIESGIKYKYAIQQENKVGLRTTPLYEKNENYRVVNFEYSYLYHDDVQIRLMFNSRISSFKHTVLTSKQDTLGDRYPHLSKNGYAYYAEFPITGLISLWMDEDQTFFKQGPDGYYYQNELVIPAYKYLENETDPTFNYDLTPNNIFVERKFREKVEEFLNNFDYKLFKSPTEGNIIIILDNVTLTPNEALGRMVYEFSATAYEVLENTIENLDEYKIISIGHFESSATEDETTSFGQISGLYTGKYTLNNLANRYISTTPTQLLDKIKMIEEIPTSGGYRTSVKKIKALSVEQYPHIDLSAELTELEARRAIALNENKDISEIDAKIQEYKSLQSYLDKTPDTKIAILEINGKEIVIGIGKIYNLDDIDEDITSITLKYTGPIIINYICDLIQIEDENVGIVTGADTSKIWGQISGIFTATDSILKQYNSEYQESKTDRVYNPRKDSSVIYGPYGDIILDNTSMNLYKSINIEDIIKQEVKRQVEIMYNIKDGFTNYDETTNQWDNGSIYYEFNGIYSLDIEADPGTILYIGKSADGSDKTEIAIGPTGRYTLNPMNNLVNFVSFKFPQFGIVNYKCLTAQLTMLKRNEHNV